MADESPWSVYFLECRGGGIYIGIARDVAARLARHRSGQGARYTRLNPPQRLLATLPCPTRREAAAAERMLKGLRALDKRRWIAALNGGEYPAAD
jgi:putative endonuclease